MTTARQVERLLRLAPYLQAHPDVAVTDVAHALGVRPKQVIADLQVLMMCGTSPYGGQLIDVDLDLLAEDGRIHIHNADILRRPMRFTPREIVPLLAGLELIDDLAGPRYRSALDSARDKLRGVAGERADAAGRVQVATASATDDVRAAIDDAVALGVRLELTYAGRTTTQRRVDVDQLVMRDGLAYLQAWSDATDDASAPGWRTFRLDRILAARTTDEPAHDHPAPPRRDTWASTLAAAETVVIDVDPRGTWVIETHPTERHEPRPDGKPGRRVHLRVAARDWFISLMLRLGDAGRVIEPADARDAVRQAAHAALDTYRETPV